MVVYEIFIGLVPARCTALQFSPRHWAPSALSVLPWGAVCLLSLRCVSALSVGSSVNPAYIPECHTSQTLPTLQLLSALQARRSVFNMAECSGSHWSVWKAEAAGS